jgi:transposase
MKPYSIDFREKVVKAYEEENTSIRKLATRFDVSKALKLVYKVLLLYFINLQSAVPVHVLT